MLVETPLLKIVCEVNGSTSGAPVLLLHGWPDDACTWNSVGARLVEQGYRTIVPQLRGFGNTRFLDDATLRTAEPTASASDAIDLLDALNIERAVVVGHDWGARTGYVMAALWPQRVERLVAMSVEYQIGNTPGSQLNYEQQRAFWYQWFFGSEHGREALTDNRRSLCRELWTMWSPTWKFDEAAAAWDNPDWVEITLHFYRVRWDNAPADERYPEFASRLNAHPPIRVPTVHLHGEVDGAVLASALSDQSPSFPAGYHRQWLPGVGHFIPREQPEAVVAAITTEPPAGFPANI